MKPIKKLGFIICLGFSVLSLASNVWAQELNLTDSINIALTKNPQVVQAAEKANSAYARLGQAAGNFLPKVSLDASVGKNYIQPMTIVLPPVLGGGSFSTSPDQAANISNYSLTLRETLFTGGKDIQGYSIADISYKAAQEEMRRVQNETIFNVTSSYYDLTKAQKSLEVINESIANLKRNLQQTQIFYDNGIGSNIDLLRVKTQLANMEISRIQAESGVKIAQLAFETNLGQKLSPEMKLKEEVFGNEETISLSREAVLDLAYLNRPDWKQYTMGLELAEKAILLNYGNFLPSITYLYSMGESRTEYPSYGSYNSDLTNWRSMLVASWSLFDGFETINQIKGSRAELNAARAQKQIISDGIALEVNSAYLNLLSAYDRIGAARYAADLAKRTLQIAEISYRSNILSEQNYLDAHAANQATQLGLISARFDFEVAKARLNKAVGKTII